VNALATPTDALRRTLPDVQTCVLQRAAGAFVYDVWRARCPAASSEAAPVLLIHGWGGTGSYWRSTAASLSALVDVVVPDLPGTGRSRRVGWAQNLYDQVDALIELLDHLHLDRVQVVGHSMGSAMALLLADAQPKRVERLVLTSLSFFVTPAQEQIYRAIMGVFSLTMGFRPAWLGNVPAMWRVMAMRYFHRLPDDVALLRQGWVDYLQLDKGTATACANNAPDAAIPQAGARVRVPVLLIACRQDQVMPPENVAFTARTIPDCDVRWIEECGHMPMIEQPDTYMALLRAFLTLECGEVGE
jgi:pimeloyl-ACP methyl ester carboxylesterase